MIFLYSVAIRCLCFSLSLSGVCMCQHTYILAWLNAGVPKCACLHICQDVIMLYILSQFYISFSNPSGVH